MSLKNRKNNNLRLAFVMENMWLALPRYGTCLNSEACYLQNSKTTYLLKYV
jgi:hypothetical protein